MSFPYTTNLQDEKIESLQTQQEHLNLLRQRHLSWLNSTGDGRGRELHQEIIELLEEVTDRYSQLLHVLHGRQDRA